jgi:hypothetical protein
MSNDASPALFQPIFELETGAVVGYEALTGPPRGVPRRLAPAVDEPPDASWEYKAIARALIAAGRLPTAPILHLHVSTQLLLAGLSLAGLVEASPWVLAIELSLDDPSADLTTVRRAIDAIGSDVVVAIRDAGRVTIHDLVGLQPGVIKIGHELTAGIARDPARQAMIIGLNYFALRTGATLIGAAVDSRQALESLLDLGVSFGQGSYLVAPVAPDEVPDAVARATQGRFPANRYAHSAPLVPSDDTPIDQVVNIGAGLALGLQRVGITTRGELAAAGAVETWRRLRQVAPDAASAGTLVALEAAIQGVRPSALSRHTRARLGVLAKVEPSSFAG